MIALSTAAALATCTASPLAGNWVGVLRDDPGAQGRIVLTSPASAPPRGFWVQPSNAFGGQEIASPLHFKVEGASRAAMPKPLLREFHINISIVCKDGTWVAQLENPERNVTGRHGNTRCECMKTASDCSCLRGTCRFSRLDTSTMSIGSTSDR